MLLDQCCLPSCILTTLIKVLLCFALFFPQCKIHQCYEVYTVYLFELEVCSGAYVQFLVIALKVLFAMVTLVLYSHI